MCFMKTKVSTDSSGSRKSEYEPVTRNEYQVLALMAFVIIALHFLGFTMLFITAKHHYHISKLAVFGLGTGILAYTLGMRHAFDADHISAIDNTTRKLMAEKKRPLSVGFFFSLGHSTVVCLLGVLLNFGIKAINSQVHSTRSALHQITGTMGTLVSGSFLYLIAILNVIILVSIIKIFTEMRLGKYSEDELENQLNQLGLMNRFFGKLSRSVDKSWKMYPIGFLFGLGFDTATEVALLVLSGSAVASGLPFWAVISLPILFTAGMTLFDTFDGCFMNFAYGWAFSRPIRKVYYNIAITGLSVVVALFIGTIELVGLLAQEFNLNGGLWDWLQNFNINKAGFVIVGLFVVTWVIAVLIWRLGRIEERWDKAAKSALEGNVD